jgi:hypothetical protein
MIPKKPGPDSIRAGHRLSKKIMLHQQARSPLDGSLHGQAAVGGELTACYIGELAIRGRHAT